MPSFASADCFTYSTNTNFANSLRETPFDMARTCRPLRMKGSRRKMRRGLPSFGTVWHHPSRGGSTLTYAPRPQQNRWVSLAAQQQTYVARARKIKFREAKTSPTIEQLTRSRMRIPVLVYERKESHSICISSRGIGKDWFSPGDWRCSELCLSDSQATFTSQVRSTVLP